MTDQEILDNAPEGVSHIDSKGNFYSSSSFTDGLRLIKDIKRIADLEDQLTKSALSNAMLTGQIAALKAHLNIVIQTKTKGARK